MRYFPNNILGEIHTWKYHYFSWEGNFPRVIFMLLVWKAVSCIALYCSVQLPQMKPHMRYDLFCFKKIIWKKKFMKWNIVQVLNTAVSIYRKRWGVVRALCEITFSQYAWHCNFLSMSHAFPFLVTCCFFNYEEVERLKSPIWLTWSSTY